LRKVLSSRPGEDAGHPGRKDHARRSI
jgi:hypothetical protein